MRVQGSGFNILHGSGVGYWVDASWFIGEVEGEEALTCYSPEDHRRELRDEGSKFCTDRVEGLEFRQ